MPRWTGAQGLAQASPEKEPQVSSYLSLKLSLAGKSRERLKKKRHLFFPDW